MKGQASCMGGGGLTQYLWVGPHPLPPRRVSSCSDPIEVGIGSGGEGIRYDRG